MCHASRRGFTLIELIVVAVILAVLVSLLLPATQAAREASRRSQCRNNLKQLALAMHNYHDFHGMFPYTCTGKAGSLPDVPRHTWVEFMLPYLEADSLYKKIDFHISNDTGTNRKLFDGVVLPMFVCPSTTAKDVFKLKNGDSFFEGGQGLFYVPCGGTLLPDSVTPDCPTAGSFCITEAEGHPSWDRPYTLKPNEYPGVFSNGITSTKISDILKGTSTTLLLGERNAEECYYGSAFADQYQVAFMGQRPNSASIDHNDPKNYTANCGFSCHHPGSILFALADGSARAISENTDFDLYCRLGDKGKARPVFDREFSENNQ